MTSLSKSKILAVIVTTLGIMSVSQAEESALSNKGIGPVHEIKLE